MNRLLGALRATYNFFSGDAITLTATLIAFALCLLLARVFQAPTAAVAIVFVMIIASGLIATLWREVAGRPRTRA
jgi:hypothetical protein